MNEIEIFDEKMAYFNKEMDKRTISLGPRFIQEKIMMRILATKYESKQFQGFVNLFKQSRHDLYQATFQNVKGFFWRNFSKFVALIYRRLKNQDRAEVTSASFST
jgi:hypothetical protein